MGEAFAWVGAVVEWLGAFIPRWFIVKVTHRAVKFVRGSRVVVCKPGIHWVWPVTTLYTIYPVVRQSINLKSQTISTMDNKSVLVSGLVVFEIDDIEAILTRTWEPDQTIADVALAAVKDVCTQFSWDELRVGDANGSLDRELRREMKKVLDTYGAKVLKVTLTDLAPVRVLKLVQATTTD
jgi:regulator of protease activity HflC (stomatin/prohibitin superfamily)